MIIDHNVVHTGSWLITNPMAIDQYMVNTIDRISGRGDMMKNKVQSVESVDSEESLSQN